MTISTIEIFITHFPTLSNMRKQSSSAPLLTDGFLSLAKQVVLRWRGGCRSAITVAYKQNMLSPSICAGSRKYADKSLV